MRFNSAMALFLVSYIRSFGAPTGAARRISQIAFPFRRTRARSLAHLLARLSALECEGYVGDPLVPKCRSRAGLARFGPAADVGSTAGAWNATALSPSRWPVGTHFSRAEFPNSYYYS